jgi:hypothetical protein
MLGVHDAAGATVLSRFTERLADLELRLEQAAHRAEVYEAEVRRIKAWYDAPRYHAVDRVRNVLKGVRVHGILRRLAKLLRL